MKRAGYVGYYCLATYFIHVFISFIVPQAFSEWDPVRVIFFYGRRTPLLYVKTYGSFPWNSQLMKPRVYVFSTAQNSKIHAE